MLETVIGLEIHVELNTKSKIFCSCSTKFGSKPNENTCPVCLGLPGTLPSLNEEAVRLAVKAGCALNCSVNTVSSFDRKNYFYPDLPKGYQITQQRLPICQHGYIDIEADNEIKRIRIKRIHMEEDAGKLIHAEGKPITLVDYNRAGVPLIEIVTEPDIRRPEEAVEFLKRLKATLEYIEASDCRMEQGSFRCDVNISVRKYGSQDFGTKVEIKNLNSFKEIYKALQDEERRQKDLYFRGEESKIVQETRKWDNSKEKTVPMRSKEDADNYRYFPEADLFSLLVDERVIKSIKESLPELPYERMQRFLKEYMLSENEVEILVGKKHIADYFEDLVGKGIDPQTGANWILVEVLRALKGGEDNAFPISTDHLASLIKTVKKGVISRTAGREVFDEIVATGKTPEQVIEEKGLAQISDTSELKKIIVNVINDNSKAVEEYKKGKEKALTFLMGQTMKESRGKANPSLARILLKDLLKS